MSTHLTRSLSHYVPCFLPIPRFSEANSIHKSMSLAQSVCMPSQVMSIHTSIISYGNYLRRCHLQPSLILLNHLLTGNPTVASIHPHPVHDDMPSH